MQDTTLTDEQIRQRIDEYTPSVETVQTLDDNGIVIFVGVTGAGKNTIMDRLVASGECYDAITSTTRLPRENNGVMEQDGVEYYFLTVNQALERMEKGEYAEVSWVHDRVNGMLASELTKAAQSGRTTITDVDIQGALKFRRLSDNARLIFVVPPSFAEWDTRNRSRYATEEEFKAAWPARRRSAIMELELVLSEADKFAFVINESLDDAVNEVRAIIAGKVDSDKQQAGQTIVREILTALQAN